MNIDIDNIPNLVERFAGGQSFEMSELFESDSMLAFCTAPYPFTFVQLENDDTYQKGIGQIIAESNETTTFSRKSNWSRNSQKRVAMRP